jgi:hypothetical protein
MNNVVLVGDPSADGKGVAQDVLHPVALASCETEEVAGGLPNDRMERAMAACMVCGFPGGLPPFLFGI